MTWYIYALIDPRTREVRYIGKSVDPLRRLDCHLDDKDSSLRKSRWLKKLGERPILKILESGVGSSWIESERWWIKFYREEVGADLTNLTDGGEGLLGIRFSAESRAKMAVRKGVKLSAEIKDRISKSLKGHPGHKHSDEDRKRMSDHRKANPTLLNWLNSLSIDERNALQCRANASRWKG